MSDRILIAYATRAGSTAGIADVIAEELQTAGYHTAAIPISDAPNPDDYDHVIVGGPIYMGSMSEVNRYCRMNEATLQSRIIGAFTVGIAFVTDDEEKQTSAKEILKRAIAPLDPPYSGYFAGMIDPARLSFTQKIVLKVVKAPIGDFRDWDAIKRWVAAIIRSLSLLKT